MRPKVLHLTVSFAVVVGSVFSAGDIVVKIWFFRNPFSPYHYLSPPYGMAHFGLPPTPTWDAVEDKSSIDEQHIPSSIVEASSSPHSPTKPASTQTITKNVIQNKPSSNGAGANGSSHKERDRDRREANSSGASSTGNGVALGQKSPPKKKRKPPPIQIDSSISNFSGDVGSAPVSQPATPYSAAYGSSQHFSVSSAGPSSAMLSPYAYGMLSPGKFCGGVVFVWSSLLMSNIFQEAVSGDTFFESFFPLFRFGPVFSFNLLTRNFWELSNSLQRERFPFVLILAFVNLSHPRQIFNRSFRCRHQISNFW